MLLSLRDRCPRGVWGEAGIEMSSLTMTMQYWNQGYVLLKISIMIQSGRKTIVWGYHINDKPVHIDDKLSSL